MGAYLSGIVLCARPAAALDLTPLGAEVRSAPVAAIANEEIEFESPIDAGPGHWYLLPLGERGVDVSAVTLDEATIVSFGERLELPGGLPAGTWLIAHQPVLRDAGVGLSIIVTEVTEALGEPFTPSGLSDFATGAGAACIKITQNIHAKGWGCSVSEAAQEVTEKLKRYCGPKGKLSNIQCNPSQSLTQKPTLGLDDITTWGYIHCGGEFSYVFIHSCSADCTVEICLEY